MVGVLWGPRRPLRQWMVVGRVCARPATRSRNDILLPMAVQDTIYANCVARRYSSEHKPVSTMHAWLSTARPPSCCIVAYRPRYTRISGLYEVLCTGYSANKSRWAQLLDVLRRIISNVALCRGEVHMYIGLGRCIRLRNLIRQTSIHNHPEVYLSSLADKKKKFKKKNNERKKRKGNKKKVGN